MRAEHQASSAKVVSLPLTKDHGKSQRCANPVCDDAVPSGKRPGARYCGDRCRLQAWALATAAKVLLAMPVSEWGEILLKARGINAPAGGVKS